MDWKPIVVGVDASPEAAWAATTGAALAKVGGTTCHLVHVTRAVVPAAVLGELPERTEDLAAAQLAHARDQVERRLRSMVPAALLDQMVVRAGRPARVLKDIVQETGAGLLILGGKHHSALGRWLAGSTGLDVARTTDVPLLITVSSRTPIRRVLAAVDVSGAAQPTIAAAERFALAQGAQLRVMSVLEPLPVLPAASSYPTTEFYNMLEEQIIREIWPLVQARDAEKVVRYGLPADRIIEEAAAWEADLLVVASHGKGWLDRLLIGSVTERLLNQLPTSLLVLPAHAYVQEREAVPVGMAIPHQLVG
ncbi:MAG TPA: universal stress protein [Gemmatimonadales bacterium]|nr:universal stress protein [Gemmatimonadales bacterium]